MAHHSIVYQPSLIPAPFVCNLLVILFPIQTVGDAISDLLTVEVILMYKGVGTKL